MKNNLFGLFDLHEGQDTQDKILETVKNNISFKGANLWILACAIIVASIGLNVNSSAVIIGAMLISPLMGPILASGFALGIYDFQLLKKSMRNLLVATLTSLAASALYFFISPFKEAQSELLARTSPNIYDVMIAFFGGLVGVIAVTRVEKGNPIPGVAIATALMPPLCTAGFGLAVGNFKFFFGALFLYTINCAFIGIATFVMVKYLKFKPKSQVDEDQQKRVRNSILIIIALIMVPSIYFAIDLYNQQKFMQQTNEFIDHEFFENTIIYKKVNYRSKTIELACLSKRFTESELAQIKGDLKNFGLGDVNLIIKQDQNLETLKKDILNQVIKSEDMVSEKDLIIQDLQNQIAEMTFDSHKLLAESSALFPEISGLSVSNTTMVESTDSIQNARLVIYKSAKELNEDDARKFKDWLRQRLDYKNIILLPLIQ